MPEQAHFSVQPLPYYASITIRVLINMNLIIQSAADADTFAAKLKNIVASIFNQLRPVKSKYYFTLFDAIYFTDSKDIVDLTEQIRQRFAEYGLVPKSRM